MGIRNTSNIKLIANRGGTPPQSTVAVPTPKTPTEVALKEFQKAFKFPLSDYDDDSVGEFWTDLQLTPASLNLIQEALHRQWQKLNNGVKPEQAWVEVNDKLPARGTFPGTDIELSFTDRGDALFELWKGEVGDDREPEKFAVLTFPKREHKPFSIVLRDGAYRCWKDLGAALLEYLKNTLE